MAEELSGVIEGTVFRNEENGYSVLEMKAGRKSVMVVGLLPAFAPGEKVRFEGEWTEHPQYGRQWKAVGCHVDPPSTLKGLERFLGSGLIRGMGPDTARRVVETFGEGAMEALQKGPEALVKVHGIGKKKARMICDSFREQYSLRQAMIFLQGYDVAPGLALKIAKRYGERTRDLLEQNPYRLVDDMEGVGFTTADRIALTIGLPEDSPFRYAAAIKYILQTASLVSGHTYLPRVTLLRDAADALRCAPGDLEESLKALVLERQIVLSDVEGETACMLESFYFAEKEVAQRLTRLLKAARGVRQTESAAGKSLESVETETGIHLSPRQREAVIAAVSEGILVITGGPGTGKTTIINLILHLAGKNVLLAAPTGRAAKRMSEATGRPAKTIHRLLEYSGEDGHFQRDEENPLDCSCLVVDEMSMVDLFLMRSLLRALRPGTRLILVGDADQLPSVGAGNVLGDILKSGVLPTVRLTEVYRQAGQSMIVLNAHAINHGQMPWLNKKGSDFFFEKKPQLEDACAAITALCRTRLPAYLGSDHPVQDIQVLSPAKKGVCGVISLNRSLQEALNPPAAWKKELQKGETLFRMGDKVIHIHNDYSLAWRNDDSGEEGEGVFNGDMGMICGVDPTEKTVTVVFDDGRKADYDSATLEELELAYALSVHKSQGSEFPCVVMPVVGGPPMLLTRNLFYTALTRARKLVVLVGREECIRQMVLNDHVARRYTALETRLREAAAGV